MTATTQTSTPAQISRIEKARSWIPYLRDLQDMHEILSNEPIYPNVGERLMELEDEIRSVKTQIIKSLEPLN